MRPRWRHALLVIAALCGLLLVTPLILGLFGLRLVVVEGGSMVPTYLPGDVVLMSAPSGDDLEVGQVVLVGDPPTAYVHRVHDTDGISATLKGDANTIPDPGSVTQEGITGIPVAHVSGFAASMVSPLTHWSGRLVLVLLFVAGAFFGLSGKRRTS